MDQNFRQEEKQRREKERAEQKKREKERKKTERKYRKSLEKQGIATSTRKRENDKIRQTDKKLNLIILVLSVLLVGLLLIIFLV